MEINKEDLEYEMIKVMIAYLKDKYDFNYADVFENEIVIHGYNGEYTSIQVKVENDVEDVG